MLRIRSIVWGLTLLLIAASLSCGKKSEVLQKFSFIAEGDSSLFVQTKSHFKLEYDSQSMGVFVKSIEGVANTKTSYWLYFVNGKPVPKAADAFVPSAGDTIEWRLISGY